MKKHFIKHGKIEKIKFGCKFYRKIFMIEVSDNFLILLQGHLHFEDKSSDLIIVIVHL